MKFNLQQDFDLQTQGVLHRIMVDALEILKTEKNFTEIGVRSAVYISIAANAFVEDVIGMLNKEEGDIFTFLAKEIEPEIQKILTENSDEVDYIVDNILDFKEREIELSGSVIHGVERILEELGKIDIDILAPILKESGAMLQKADKKETKVQAEDLIAEADAKTQEMINRFKSNQ